MIGMKLGWLLLECIFLSYFLYFGSSEALAIGIVLILIPICLFVINLYVRGKITATITADLNIKKGGSGKYIITLENPTVFPIFLLQCRANLENQLNKDKKNYKVSTWLPPKRKKQLTIIAGSNYCGRLKLSLIKVTAYDCFGVIGIGCKCRATGYMTVQPDTFEMNVTLIPNANTIEESDEYSQERRGNDLTETFQIREYTPGDSLRQVHWKLSSKFDRLIVRDPALPIIRNVLVFWERTGELDVREDIDAEGEIVVSLCKSLLDESIRFTIGWNDTDRNLCVLHEIRDMDELIGVIPRLMRATGCKNGVSGAELLLQTHEHALCGHMVYIAKNIQPQATELSRYGHVTMVLGAGCGEETAMLFDSVNYKEQLSRIEL